MTDSEPIERSLLGTLLCDTDGGYAHLAITLGVSADKFYSAFHRDVFAAIHAAAIDGKAGTLAVLERMTVQDGELVLKLSSLSSEGTTGAQLEPLCRLVVGAWRKRQLHRAGAELVEIAQKPIGWDETWAEAGPAITKAQELAHDVRTETTEDIVRDAKEDWIRRMSQPEESGLSWGLVDLNQALGLIRQEFLVIAARPSLGKSTIAGQIASAAMRPKNGPPAKVAIFNCETPNREFIARLVIHELQYRIDRAFTKEQIARVIAKYDEIGKRPYFHVFDKIQDIDRIEAKILTLAAGPGVDLVVVDYLQIVSVAGKAKEHREQQVAEVSRRLKLLVNRIGKPIIGIAQINREAEKDGRRPRMSDLRESGQIEQDADRIVFLHCDQPPSDSLQSAEIVQTAFIQEKCKNGPKGVAVPLEFNRPLFTFRCMPERPQQPQPPRR